MSELKAILKSDEVWAEVLRRANKLRKQGSKPQNHSRAIAELRAKIENLTDAIASGALRDSPSLGERLKAYEDELGRLEAESQKADSPPAEKLIPRQKEAYRRLVDDLENRLDQVETDQARAELLKLHGKILG